MSLINKQKIHLEVIQFLSKASVKLCMNSLPTATAATIYHKFFEATDLENYDPYLIATTALYLAGKVEEDHVKLRDVINVAFRCLHPNKPPLDLDATYWLLRDSVVQCELLIIRVLCFNVSFDHPHKYLLQYIKSVTDWLEPEMSKYPLARTAWSILRDSYHTSTCLRYPPTHVAVTVLYMTLEIHGVEVPYNHQAEKQWWKALVSDINKERIHEIMALLCDVYESTTAL